MKEIRKKKLILFTLRGTLFLPTEQIRLVWIKAITDSGLIPNRSIIYDNKSESFKEKVIPLLAKDGKWTELQKQTVINNVKKILDDQSLCSPGLTKKVVSLKNMGYELGIVTNHSKHYLSKRLHQIGLSEEVFKVIKTNDDEIKKPDARILNSVLEEFPPEDIVFVGHCNTNDFCLAKVVGIDFVAITSVHPAGFFQSLGVPKSMIYSDVTSFIDAILN